jgi:hypothetical protein
MAGLQNSLRSQGRQFLYLTSPGLKGESSEHGQGFFLTCFVPVKPRARVVSEEIIFIKILPNCLLLLLVGLGVCDLRGE